MIVQKFGGTSVADAERIGVVCRIVAQSVAERPVVVVSALAGVTDLLAQAVDLARRGDREGLDPVLADLGRRHRWAVSGAIRDAGRRHDLSLAVDASLEELRTLLRSVRILGEGTPRSADVLLAFGETLSSRIVAAALEAEGVPARWIDPHDVVATDGRHGRAEPDLPETANRARATLSPLLARGEVPVTGGFVGAAPDGSTTTLGRGGSDTSAAVIGSVLGAREVQIWTDVDGILTADPRIVPTARLRPVVSFAEAAEAAHYGARVLHPSSVSPAVLRGIPVRVRNTAHPEGEGTTVLATPAAGSPPLCCITSLSGFRIVRAATDSMRFEPTFAPDVLRAIGSSVLAGVGALEVAVTEKVAAADEGGTRPPPGFVGGEGDRSILCVVGNALSGDPAVRRSVAHAMADLAPDLLVLGASRCSAAVVLSSDRRDDSIREMHRRFFEEGPS